MYLVRQSSLLKGEGSIETRRRGEDWPIDMKLKRKNGETKMLPVEHNKRKRRESFSFE